jgi:hypothetical protein
MATLEAVRGELVDVTHLVVWKNVHVCTGCLTQAVILIEEKIHTAEAKSNCH